MDHKRPPKTAFIGHPTDLNLYRSYIRFLKPEKTYRDEFIVKLFEWTPPYKVKDFSRLSLDGKNHIDALLIMVPFLPEMRDIKLRRVIAKIDEALAIAAREGCTVAALGGFASIVVQGQERDFAEKHGIAVTSGNSLTAAIIIKSIETIAEKFDIDLAGSTVAIIGASGDIGSACMGYLGARVKRLYCTGRSSPTLKEVVQRHAGYMTSEIIMTDNNREAVDKSAICIFVTSAYTHLFSAEDFRPGTVVCDASAPLNVKAAGGPRDDVFIYHGGIASLPFPLDAGFDLGLPGPYTFYGCQLEGLLLGLNPRLPCSWGRGNISREKLELFINEMDAYPSMNPVYSIGNMMYGEDRIESYAKRWKAIYGQSEAESTEKIKRGEEWKKRSSKKYSAPSKPSYPAIPLVSIPTSLSATR
jgi:fatty aldehyde-generating acyl-ACP reductase